MGIDASEALRYAMDWSGLALASIESVSPYSGYLVQVLNSQLDFDQTISSRIISETRITVADGYRSYAPGDGYLNAMVKQESGSQFVISQGQLTNNHLILGPLVFPYTFNGFSGGVDPAVLQPALGSNSNVGIYIQIRGPALSLNGNLFNVEEIIIDGMAGLSYSLRLDSNMKVAG